MVLPVIHCVERPWERKSISTHLLTWKNFDHLLIVVNVVYLSHFTEYRLNYLFVFVSFYLVNWQFTARLPSKSIAHQCALTKILLFFFCSHFCKSHFYSIRHYSFFTEIDIVFSRFRRLASSIVFVWHVTILCWGESICFRVYSVPFGFVVGVWQVNWSCIVHSKFWIGFIFARLIKQA